MVKCSIMEPGFFVNYFFLWLGLPGYENLPSVFNNQKGTKKPGPKWFVLKEVNYAKY